MRERPIPVATKFIAFICIAIAALAGCSRTVVGGFSDSPDKKYRVNARTYGAYGRPYLEETLKRMVIYITDTSNPGRNLFEKEYRVKGCDVCWDATWNSNNNVSISIYDFGPAKSSYDLRGQPTRTNHLRTINFQFDAATGMFTDRKAVNELSR
jgi:hypothetical protein